MNTTPHISNPPTRRVTVDELATILGGIKSARPAGIVTLTEVKAKKTGNPFGTIRKLARANIFLSFDYAESVRRQQSREGYRIAHFTPNPHLWAERESPCLSKHPVTGKLYLRAKVEKASPPIYLYQRSSGAWSPVEEAKVKAFLPNDDASAARAAEYQGVEKPVIFRQYSLSNLVSITLNGVRYRVKREATNISSPTTLSPTRPAS